MKHNGETACLNPLSMFSAHVANKKENQISIEKEEQKNKSHMYRAMYTIDLHQEKGMYDTHW